MANYLVFLVTIVLFFNQHIFSPTVNTQTDLVADEQALSSASVLPPKEVVSQLGNANLFNWSGVTTMSSQGNLAAGRAWDGSVIIWDVAKQEEILRFSEGRRGISKIVFSPDKHYLAVIFADGFAQLWSIGGYKRRVASFGGTVTCCIKLIKFSPDTSKLAAIEGLNIDKVKILDVASGRVLCEIKDRIAHDIGAIVFSPNGQMLAMHSHKMGYKFWNVRTKTTDNQSDVKVFDISTQKAVFSLVDMEEECILLTFSPDSRFLLIGARGLGGVSVWNIGNKQKVFDWQVDRLACSFGFVIGKVCFSPDGKNFAVQAIDGRCEVFSFPTVE